MNRKQAATVLEGTGEGILRRAVGHFPDTPLPGEPGNAALAGHRDTFFRSPARIRSGDRIAVETLDGVHGPAPQHFVVHASAVEPDRESPATPAARESPAAREKGETP